MDDKQLWDILLRPLPLSIGTIVTVKDKRYKAGTYKGMILARMMREGKVITYIIDLAYKRTPRWNLLARTSRYTSSSTRKGWIVSARPDSILSIEEE